MSKSLVATSKLSQSTLDALRSSLPAAKIFSKKVQFAYYASPQIPELSKALDDEPLLPRGLICYGPHILQRYQLDQAVVNELGNKGVDAAAKILLNVATARKARVRVIAEVIGLRCARRVDLGQETVLIPWSKVPRSTNADTVAYLHRGIETPNYLWEPVAMVISKEFHRSNDHKNPLIDELKERCSVLTLVGNAAPVVGRVWTEFEDKELRRSDPFDRSHRMANFEGRTPLWIEPPFVKGADARILLGNFRKLHDELRASVKIALSRLNLARRRVDMGDRAIDGAIALEALLGKETTELKYRYSVRAARLLESNFERRLLIKDQLSLFYDLRSAVVHGGQIPAKLRKDSPTIVENGLRIVDRILQHIIRNGRNEALDGIEFK